jgi:hypothetical protein
MAFSPSELQKVISQIYDIPGQPPRRKIVVPYSYQLNFLAVGVGATVTQTLSITANADFIHCATAVSADLAGAAQNLGNAVLPNVTILITDSGTNEQFSSAPVPLMSFATKVPNRDGDTHVYPRFIAGRSSLTVQVTSYEAVNTPNIRITLEGVLVRILD